MKTKYENIVHVPSIGLHTNPLPLTEIMKMASEERLTPAIRNTEQVAVLCIDLNMDFIVSADGKVSGSLGVPGSAGDIERATKWIYENMDKISRLIPSIDTHNPWQIFHPCYWVDKDGNNPAPFTMITEENIKEGPKYRSPIDPKGAVDYVVELKKKAQKDLCIWPYHCINGTPGHALDAQFSNMLYFYSVAKSSYIRPITKGTDPATEMYGIFKPEYDPKGYIDLDMLNALQKYDKIVIWGEAKSHCVLESIRQLLEHYASEPKITSKVHILEDCMSSVVHPAVDFEAIAQNAFDEFKSKYKVNIVKSTEFSL